MDPSVRERAEVAARRAGMSLTDWLNSTIGESPVTPPMHGYADHAPPAAPPQPPRYQARPGRSSPAMKSQPAPMPQREVAEVADIHQRLDAIARQIEEFSRPNQRSNDEPGVARQLNDAISRLDARLSQISEQPRRSPPSYDHHDPRPDVDMVERAAKHVYREAPKTDPFSLDFAIAEIAARQGELDGPPRMAPRHAPPIAPHVTPPPPMPDMSGLERQLSQITSKIDALQRPNASIEQSITGFRSELAEIRNAVTEALPRRAIESIEGEIRALSQRIDATRSSGIDADVLANLEAALGDIHKTLRTLTPAEQLAGFDEAIRNLGNKIDQIVRSSDNPGTLEQLEGALGALRSIVSNVATNEAVGRLSDDLRALSSKVDQLAQNSDTGMFAALEQRIVTLTASLENRDRPSAANSDHLESALAALAQRLDHMPVGNDPSSAFTHLEQRVSYLLERMETVSDPRANFGRVEDGLQDILRHLERQQSMFAAALNESRADAGVIDSFKRDMSDMRFSQSETDRHMQDSLEVVHSTLGHVVDRLAKIEGDLRTASTRPAPQPAVSAPMAQASQPAPMQPAMAAPPRPQMPNPVKPQAAAPSQIEVLPPQAHFDAAPREFAATAISSEPAPAFQVPKAISDILDPKPASNPSPKPVPKPAAPAVTVERPSPRPTADSQLPPDHPLEPGTRPQGRGASPSERIAASEDAISDIVGAAPEPASASSFIAAARRAAQAAAATGDKPKAAKPVKSAQKSDGDKGTSTFSSKIRSLLVGASVVVIVLGSFKMAMTLLDDGGSTPPMAANSHSPPLYLDPPNASDTPTQSPASSIGAPSAAPSIGTPSLFAPRPAPETAPARQSAPVPQAAPVPYISPDVTGSIGAPQSNSVASPPVLPPSGQKLGTVTVPAGEKLPDAIGGAALRNAALKGDATAAFEVGARYAEGRGVPQNYEEAAKWYDRAAQAGVVPGMFRLGTLYEKGLGLKKDWEVARRYYMQAAERGNAKAMHNLAVLDADGGTRGANYKSASLWFRKAADRGVADSQFNLGILYARGIGVDQNLAESFKWFSLAAAQGDVDAGKKRDDVAKRLDPQSLAAAKLAIQTFVAEGQPEDAISVATPAGGWDAAAPQAARPANSKRAAR
jgi:localization factor PodJL